MPHEITDNHGINSKQIIFTTLNKKFKFSKGKYILLPEIMYIILKHSYYVLKEYISPFQIKFYCVYFV